MGVPADEIQSRHRTQTVTQARRVAVVLWTRGLWRYQVEIIGVLGISAPSASELASGATPEERKIAGQLAHELWEKALNEERLATPGRCVSAA